MSLTFRKNIKKIDKSQWEDHLKTEKERLSTMRSQESEEEIKMRRIADASRNVDMREEETSDEHQSRIAIQKHRQEQLRIKETPQEKKERQNSENESKVFKRAAKAGAFEKSYNPNKDWNSKLDADMVRQQKRRDIETDEQKKVRRDKDNCYQQVKRAGFSNQEKNNIKQEKIKSMHDKRREDKAIRSGEWIEIHRQKNIDQLREHGSYLRFLLSGKARTHFYGQYLPQTTDVKDWKLIVNKISNDVMMGSQFFALSKQLAFMFQNIGLVKNDVVHFVIGNHNHNIAVLGGVWIIGGICSFSELTTNIKVIEHQVSTFFRGTIAIFMG